MRRPFCLALALALLPGPAVPTVAQGVAPQIDRIEEDWQVVIDSPSVAEDGPQITTCMYPGQSDGLHPFIAFDLNYREYPQFQEGGLQVQVWADENGDVISYATQHQGQLATDGEIITWTQAMSLSGTTISFDINNGQSDTWVHFGQGGQLSVQFATPLTDLTLYSPDVSAAKSGVTWESQRATSMTLLQVRYYAGGNLIAVDSNPRSITLN
jgi:hypothetical protein